MRWIPYHYRAKTERAATRVAQRKWHRWWAWRPVYIKGYKADTIEMPPMRIWREYVERRGSWNAYIGPGGEYFYGSLFWEYRPTDDQSNPRSNA